MTAYAAIAICLMWLKENSHYGDAALQVPAPYVVFVPRAHVCALAKFDKEQCRKEGQGVMAFHDGDHTIFMRYKLSDFNDAYSFTVLFHELVHHVQHNQKPKMSIPCMEVEAYTLQAKLEAELKMPSSVDGLLVALYKAECG